MTPYTTAYEYVRKLYDQEPEVGIILGTGLGGLVNEIEIEKKIPYNFIPHFPIATVESHFGALIFGTLRGKKVVAMQGRFHYYEGYSMQQITFPVRIMKMLGIKTLLVSNASGALNLDYQNGDLVIIDDHINLLGDSPLSGPNLDDFGPRFPGMVRPYDPDMAARALEIAKEDGTRIQVGVYVGVKGPNLETRAEYRYLRIIGGDVVGMSTVPEVIVARHMGIRTFAISVVTDIGDPDNLEEVTLADMIEIAGEAEPKLTRIFAKLVEEL
ncbi:MAG: purine-nucleoside phosphorylase [Bacteroidota bacterium]